MTELVETIEKIIESKIKGYSRWQIIRRITQKTISKKTKRNNLKEKIMEKKLKHWEELLETWKKSEKKDQKKNFLLREKSQMERK